MSTAALERGSQGEPPAPGAQNLTWEPGGMWPVLEAPSILPLAPQGPHGAREESCSQNQDVRSALVTTEGSVPGL